MRDSDRAESLGMTVDQFQVLVGHDPLEQYPEFFGAGVVDPKGDHKASNDDSVKTENESTSLKITD